jgi:ABC-type phosphate transport system substrate-binding protein
MGVFKARRLAAVVSTGILTALAAYTFGPNPAYAGDVLKIIGGPSGIKMLELVKPDLERVSGAKIDFSVTPTDIGMSALYKRLVDGVVIGNTTSEILVLAEKKGMPKDTVDNYETVEFAYGLVKVGLHPDNKARALTHEQLVGILSGKITNWSAITGQDLPIKVYLPKYYITTTAIIPQHYLHAAESPIAEYVLDKDGLLRGMKSYPGAIAFFPTREDMPGFSPRYLDTEAHFPISLVVKKPLTEKMQKLIEYLRAQPKVKTM